MDRTMSVRKAKNRQNLASGVLFLLMLLVGTALAGNNSGAAFSTWPDTGQTKCYNNTEKIPCPVEGEPFYGQDAQYHGPARSYTVLGGGTMVQDNVTGLIWELKNSIDGVVDYSNPNDADNTYTWCDPNTDTNGGYAGTCGTTDTKDFIDQLNSGDGFGGYTNWRLPSIKELSTLLDNERTPPTIPIDPVFASTTQKSLYWSSTTYAFYNEGALYVYFNYTDYGNNSKFLPYYVRAVRGGQLPPESRFVDENDGTVTDTVTCLQWQKETIGPYTWKDALATSEDLVLAGYNDWRLPNRNELYSLIDYNHYSPAIDPIFTVPVQSSSYWSSTPADYYFGSWMREFNHGWEGIDNRMHSYYVRAVRGRQCDVIGPLEPLEISLSSTSGAPGSTVAITGSGFTVGGSAKLYITKPDDSAYPVEDILVDNYGKIWFPWQIPQDAVDGKYSIRVLDVQSGRSGPVVLHEVKANQIIFADNFKFANVDVQSNYFSVWMDITKGNNKNLHICEGYTLVVSSGSGMSVGMPEDAKWCTYVEDGVSNAGNSSRYRLRFKINHIGRAAWFENGKITLVDKTDPQITHDLLEGLSVYGTTFNITQHAWQFSNGIWTEPTRKLNFFGINEYFKYMNVIRHSVPSVWKGVFWRSFENNGNGACVGLALAATADFTHSDENSWGTGDTVDSWKTEIEEHWPDDAVRASGPFKPLPENSFAYNEFDEENMWTLQAAKKIMYYHAGYNLFSGFGAKNGVGAEGFRNFDPSYIEFLLKKGVPAVFKFSIDRGEFINPNHATLITQLISWSGGDAFTVWDNRLPASKAKKYKIANYLQWLVEKDSVYSALGKGSLLSSVNTFTAALGEKVNDNIYDIKMIGVEDDPHNIYNLRTATTSGLFEAPKSLSSTQSFDSSSSPQTADEAVTSKDHIEVIVVGAQIDQVSAKALSQKVLLIPNGEIETGKAIIESTTAGIFNFLYLPVTTDYRIDFTKISGFDGLNVIAKYSFPDGQVKEIQFDDLPFAAEDATQAYFYVGRNNTDDELHLLTGETYSPEYTDTTLPGIGAPVNFRGVFEPGGVRLNWQQTIHPSFDHVQVVRKSNGFPESPTDGTIIYSGNAEQAVDTTAVANYLYFYAAFSVDSSGKVSPRTEITIDSRRFSIEGTISKADNLPLSGARVVLSNGSQQYQAYTGPDGKYTLSNLENNPYTLTAEKNGYAFRNAPRNVDINVTNRVEDFVADSVPGLTLLFDLSRAYINNSYDIRWGYANLSDSDTVNIRLNRNGTWGSIATGVPIGNGVFTWPVIGSATDNAVLEISASSNSNITSTSSLSIQDAPDTLRDAIRYLQVIVGLQQTGIDVNVDDINDDGKIGLEEAINALKKLSQ